MGLPVTIYRYTDAGAPQLVSNTPSEWVNVLKKVLVEGYGSKLPLGWTLEFENTGTYRAAFRNSLTDGGSGGYFQFGSYSGSNAANTQCSIRPAAGMSAIDSFIKPLYSRAFNLGGSVKGWEIIGTSRGFYLIAHLTTNLLNAFTNQVANYQSYFIGDIESSIDNDSHPFTLCTSTNASGDSSSAGDSGFTGPTVIIYAHMNSVDGSASNHLYSFSKLAPFTASLVPDGNAELLGISHKMTPVQIIGQWSTLDSNGITQMNSTTMPYVRGVIPGLHMSSFAGYRTENWPTEITQAGVKWVLLRSYHSPQMWVETGDWYD